MSDEATRPCPACDRTMKPVTFRKLPAWKCGGEDCPLGILVDTQDLPSGPERTTDARDRRPA